MSTISDRYDATAAAYLRWWSPVLAPTALRVLDAVAPAISGDGDGLRLVDVGTGTGILAIEAARRWPSLVVTGVDPAAGMLDVARAEAERVHPGVGRRIDFRVGLADRTELPDGQADIVVSSFVFQLVPDRGRALREAFRILRPGGTLAYVTWRIGKDAPFAPDEAFYDALDEAGIPDADPVADGRVGDIPSPEAAAAQARRAGFREVRARAGWLEHRHDRGAYLRFLEEYAERDAFASLTADEARTVRTATRRRLARLRPDDFTWRAPVITLRAIRPPAGGTAPG